MEAANQKRSERLSFACTRCRRRKIRCDRAKPCGHCHRGGHGSSCCYPKDGEGHTNFKTAGKKPKTANGSLESSCEMIQTTQNSLSMNHLRDDGQDSDVSRTSSNAVKLPGSKKCHYPSHEEFWTLGPNISNAARSCVIINSPPSRPSQDSDWCYRALSNTNGIKTCSELDESCLGHASYPSFTIDKPTPPLISGCEHGTKTKHAQIYLLSQKCQRLSRALHQRHAGLAYGFDPGSLQDLPAKHICDSLIQEYFNQFEYVFRILDDSSFRARYNNLWLQQEIDETLLMQLRLILSMVMSTTSGTTIAQIPDWQARSALWIDYCQSWLASPMRRSKSSFEDIQTHCLFLVAFLLSGEEPEMAYPSANLLIKSALHLGLHKITTEIGPNKLHKAVWNTICELVLQVSMDSGQPNLVSDDMLGFTSAVSAEQSTLDKMECWQSFTTDTIPQCLTNCFSIRLKTAKALHQSSGEPSYHDMLRLGEDLATSLRAQCIVLDSIKQPQTDQPSDFHRKMFTLLTQRFLIALHMPYTMSSGQNMIYYFSRKVCFEAALAILMNTGLNHSAVYVEKDLEEDRIFGRAEMRASGFFWQPFLFSSMTFAREALAQASGDIHACEALLSSTQSDWNKRHVSNFFLKNPKLFLQRLVDMLGTRLEFGPVNDVNALILLAKIVSQLRSCDSPISDTDEVVLDHCNGVLDRRLYLQRDFSDIIIQDSLNTSEASASESALYPLGTTQMDQACFLESDINFGDWFQQLSTDNPIPAHVASCHTSTMTNEVVKLPQLGQFEPRTRDLPNKICV